MGRVKKVLQSYDMFPEYDYGIQTRTIVLPVSVIINIDLHIAVYRLWDLLEAIRLNRPGETFGRVMDWGSAHPAFQDNVKYVICKWIHEQGGMVGYYCVAKVQDAAWEPSIEFVKHVMR